MWLCVCSKVCCFYLLLHSNQYWSQQVMNLLLLVVQVILDLIQNFPTPSRCPPWHREAWVLSNLVMTAAGFKITTSHHTSYLKC